MMKVKHLVGVLAVALTALGSAHAADIKPVAKAVAKGDKVQAVAPAASAPTAMMASFSVAYMPDKQDKAELTVRLSEKAAKPVKVVVSIKGPGANKLDALAGTIEQGADEVRFSGTIARQTKPTKYEAAIVQVDGADKGALSSMVISHPMDEARMKDLMNKANQSAKKAKEKKN